MSTWFRSKKGIVFTSVMANTIIMSTSLRDNTVMLSSSVTTYTVLVHQNDTEVCEQSSRNFLLSKIKKVLTLSVNVRKSNSN